VAEAADLELQLPESIARATEHQPRARLALAAALAAGPSHAYLFRGPRGSGKRSAARAFAAELLAGSAPDPEAARRRALLDPSPHPDLVWLTPSGAQHMVEEVRERVIRQAAYRPFEGGSRVFVIDRAESMRDESQNALLKTLEEPPPYAHLILSSSDGEALLETIVSRCQSVEFSPLPVEALVSELGEAGSGELEREAAARLAGGNLERARFLLSAEGAGLRGAVEKALEAVFAGELERGPWGAILKRASDAGAAREDESRSELEEEVAEGRKLSARELADEAKRIGRRERTEQLDLGLELAALWLRDLAAIGAGAPQTVHNRDRLEQLGERASGTSGERARRAAELVVDTRRRLDLNVSEELALEALFYRLERLLTA
jgi:DNA polymerase III subunit delta'